MRALALVSLVVLAASAPNVASEGPCAVPHFIVGTQIVRSEPGEYVRVTFRLDAPSSEWLWAGASWHEARTGAQPTSLGFAAERAAATLFLEDAEGKLVTPPDAVMMHPYGIQATVADADLRLAAQDNDSCGAVALAIQPTLEPGEYVMTVLAGTDTLDGGAAFLPLGASVTHVARGPLQVATEATLTCTAKAHAMAVGSAAAALVGCEQRFEASARAYHAVFVGRWPDATHSVQWDPSGGRAREVRFFDAGVEGPGASALLVPRYVTPLGHPFGLPASAPGMPGSDGGIFALFADV